MAERAWQKSASRRRVIVAVLTLMLPVLVGGITLYKKQHPTPPPSPDTLYREGMRALKGDGRPKDLDEAKKLFSAVLLAGDARGDLGIACVLWQRYPEIARYSDGPAGQRLELAQEQLRYAANHGVVAARAALLSYDIASTLGVITTGDEIDAMAQLIAAIKDTSKLNDPSLPPPSLIDSGVEAYLAATLGYGLCAPQVSTGAALNLIRRAQEPLSEKRNP